MKQTRGIVALRVGIGAGRKQVRRPVARLIAESFLGLDEDHYIEVVNDGEAPNLDNVRVLPMCLDGEIWKDIPSLDGYQASNIGRIRSTGKARKPKVLRTQITKGYQVTICGKRNVRSVHSLVAEAFLGPRPDGMHVCHWDGNPLNNRIENLRYGTPTENNEDRRRHGRLPMGDTSPMSKLTSEQVKAIRSSDATNAELGARFGVTTGHVWKIRNKDAWAHID